VRLGAGVAVVVGVGVGKGVGVIERVDVGDGVVVVVDVGVGEGVKVGVGVADGKLQPGEGVELSPKSLAWFVSSPTGWRSSE
jgi:hypothetical protein